MTKPDGADAGRPYRVIRDTREQACFWDFPAAGRCLGTEVRGLKTGDYTLEGFEGVLAIERKGTAGEFAANLFQPRFAREMARMDAFEHPYLVLEFSFSQLVEYPAGSGIPKCKWKYLRATPRAVVREFHLMQLRHPRLRVAFVGPHGREFCSSLFKRITDSRA
jgi:hypothetical protein